MLKLRNRRPRREGFTLTELLIVLAILVMLVALVVPRFLGTQKKADRQTAESQIGLFRGALERYALDTKDYPVTEQGLEALFKAPAGEEESSVAGWDGPYVNGNGVPKDPWGNPYQYAYPPERGGGPDPDIWSFGPDKEDNTEDDICSWGAAGSGAGSGEEGLDDLGGEDLDMDIDIDVDLEPMGDEL